MWSLSRLISNPRVRQVMLLYGSMLLGLAISIGVSVANTRFLGAQSFGDLKFLQNLFTFSVTCMTFGLFVSGGRLLANEESARQQQKMFGAQLIAVAVISITVMALMVMFSYIEVYVFDSDLGGDIRLAAPLLFVFPLQICLENALKGQNRITELSVLRVMPGLLYLVFVLALTRVSSLALDSALMLYMSSLGLVGVVISIRLQPNLRGVFVPSRIRELISETRTYGFHVYTGILGGVATTQLAGLAVAYFMDTKAVGFFLLARTITMPLSVLPTNIGTIFYRTFASRNEIPPKVTAMTIGVSLSAYLVFALIIGLLVEFLYGADFIEIIPICYILGASSIITGIGSFFNNFVCVKGYGKYARNAAFVIGFVNVAGYLLLIPAFDLYGAAMTALLASIAFLFMIVRYYILVKKELVRPSSMQASNG